MCEPNPLVLCCYVVNESRNVQSPVTLLVKELLRRHANKHGLHHQEAHGFDAGSGLAVRTRRVHCRTNYEVETPFLTKRS
jgi:hypothetical protein